MRRVWPVLLVAPLLYLACNEDTGEADQIKEAVSSFLQEAYGAGGDVEFAYSLLAAETRATCSKDDFRTVALAARQANGDRSLQTDRFSDIRVAGQRATLKVDSDYDRTPRFFPLEATVVKEGGVWRYLVTTDPTCKSVPKFFQHGPA